MTGAQKENRKHRPKGPARRKRARLHRLQRVAWCHFFEEQKRRGVI